MKLFCNQALGLGDVFKDFPFFFALDSILFSGTASF